MTGSNMMVLHHILAETFGKFWITNIHSAGSVEDRWPINSEADLRVRIQKAFVSVTEEMITNTTKLGTGCKDTLVICNSIFSIFLNQINAQRGQKIIIWVEYFPYKYSKYRLMP
jgi:hypothetical protein